MKITIETHLIINGSKGFRRGPFTVNTSDFKKDPDFTVACKAYEFIQWQLRQHCYTTYAIEKVIYDGEHDITELTKKLDPCMMIVGFLFKEGFCNKLSQKCKKV